METENGKDCNLCADETATMKLILCNLQTGEKLDAIDICQKCLEKYGNNLELQSGTIQLNKDK